MKPRRQVSVLDVADCDELWAMHAAALRRAGVFVTQEQANVAMRSFWVDGGTRARPGDLAAAGLSKADRRLLVAWTWPNQWGVAAPRGDVFERVRAESQWQAGSDPEAVWAEEVRQRVSAVVKRLNTWHARDGLGVLWAATSLFRDDAAAQERVLALKYAAEPLIAEWLLELSHHGTLVFDEQFTELGAWAYDAVALRAALAAREDVAEVAGALSKVFTSRADLSQLRAETERVLAELVENHAYDPRVFHAQLPVPPAPGLKFSQLFEYLDVQRGTVSMTFEQIHTLVPKERPVGTRGKFIPGLPDGARKPQWWANLAAGDRVALAKFPQARAWLAAGMVAHPKVRGGDRRVERVEFDVRPDRHLWWNHRFALRLGTFTPWEQLVDGPERE